MEYCHLTLQKFSIFNIEYLQYLTLQKTGYTETLSVYPSEIQSLDEEGN